ncbi:DNA polymerase III delta subunit [Fulvivirga imtechensis AK7]|uniref:DNA polymerase III subunit delta n=1 Tax=Fulvivirga imtechensis AK7 TaxID=1237149 RepID=L8JPE6_9BACT|nr:DNA polymerase III subunit delta [Fulvivirga imtechensis]ELR70816.1 DNA polymerase III delta subunit [Fulvivirga imtechensis AK7]
MAVTPESVLSDLKNKKYAPVYFLQGEETYYIDMIADYIEDNVLSDAEKGFNQTILYGRDVAMNVVLTNARRFPMMAEKQVVIVKEAQNISDINKEAGQKLLTDYLQNPVPSTILVFCYKNKTLDKRKTLGKTIEKQAVTVTTKKLYDNQVPAWVEQYIRSKGFGATPKAIQMLADSIGNDLERLANEVDKMLINFKEKVQIDESTVQRYVGISKDYNVFELQKALISKDVVKANKIVNYFEANSKKNPIIPVIAILFSFYSKLLVAVHAKDKSERNLASLLKVSPYFVKDYLFALRNYSPVQVINNIHHIKEADLKSKGVDNISASDGQLLRELVFKLLH